MLSSFWLATDVDGVVSIVMSAEGLGACEGEGTFAEGACVLTGCAVVIAKAGTGTGARVWAPTDYVVGEGAAEASVSMMSGCTCAGGSTGCAPGAATRERGKLAL